MSDQDPFSGMNQVKTSSIKWGKPGDWIRGTLTDNTREVPNKLSGKPGDMQTVFEFKASGGSFHNINEDKTVAAEPTILEAGSFWSVFAKAVLKSKMKNCKIGQTFGMRFVREEPNKTPGLNPTKIIDVFLGEMDPTYSGETAGDVRPPLN